MRGVLLKSITQVDPLDPKNPFSKRNMVLRKIEDRLSLFVALLPVVGVLAAIGLLQRDQLLAAACGFTTLFVLAFVLKLKSLKYKQGQKSVYQALSRGDLLFLDKTLFVVEKVGYKHYHLRDIKRRSQKVVHFRVADERSYFVYPTPSLSFQAQLILD